MSTKSHLLRSLLIGLLALAPLACSVSLDPPGGGDPPAGNPTPPPDNSGDPGADPDGNPGDADALAVLSLVPNAGGAAGGTRVSIAGKGFTPTTAVYFGAAPATEVTYLHAGGLTAVAPARTPGVVDVIVVNPGDVVTARSEESVRVADGFLYLTEPAEAAELTVLGISPSAGKANAATPVTITGSGFRAPMAVLFGATPADDVVVESTQVITATAPKGVYGTVVLQLIDPDNQSVALANAYNFLEEQTNVIVVPSAGGSNGGNGGGTGGGNAGDGGNPPPDDDGTDTDGDGRTDVQEAVGYDILVDNVGFGTDPRNLVRRHVTSDPTKVDTDGDGLPDAEEFDQKIDPRSNDTDGDGLFDKEEIYRWYTSPISVDTDGDARGPDGNLPPFAGLFDGGELIALRDAQGFLIDRQGQRLGAGDIVRVVIGGTSPSLDDTDGDGQTDYDEADDPVRTPNIADLPQAEIEIVDRIDIALDVAYEESEGEETTYATSVATGTSRSLARADSTANTHSAEYSLGIESGTEGVKVTNEFTYGFSHETATEVSTEDTTSAQQEHSRSVTDSRTRTETSAAGRVSLGIQVRNTGTMAYALTNLGMTMRLWEPSQTPDPATGRFGSFRTLASLTAPLGDFTLAPGGVSTVLQLSAEGLSANLVRRFLAQPSAIFLETATFELENAQGINFNFLTETTFSRTALVVIDYGDGTFEQYRVATNVDRDPDDAHFVGISMGQVMTDVLGIDYEVGTTGLAGAGGTRAAQLRSVTRADGTEFAYTPTAPGLLPESRWVIFASAGIDLDDAGSNALAFNDLMLHNRDEIRLVFDRDQDGDGIYARKEFLYGTIDQPVDVNDDGVFDAAEIQAAVDTDQDQIADPVEMDGWWVDAATLPADIGYPRRVFPNPTTVDSDGDGRDDFAEMLGADGLSPADPNDAGDATDPTNPDTDADGLADGIDAYPLVPAVTLHVDANVAASGDGRTWAGAMKTLREALDFAAGANDASAPGFDPVQVVSEIWVADGVYTPSGAAALEREDTFRLFNNVGIYGGFAGLDSAKYPGGERRRLQRNPDPRTNGTVLDGDLAADGPANNSFTVVTSDSDPSSGAPIDGSAILDGFTITGGRAGDLFPAVYAPQNAHYCGGGLYNASGATPTLQNLFVTGNFAVYEGAGMADYGGATVAQCTFNANEAEIAYSRFGGQFSGGGAVACRDASTTFADCVFSANNAIIGGGLYLNGGAVRMERCTLSGNSAIAIGDSDSNLAQGGDGGGLYVAGGAHFLANCALRSNGSRDETGTPYNFRSDWWAGGGGAYVNAGSLALVNCAFWNNRTDWSGGGMNVHAGKASLTNCSFSRNDATSPNTFDSYGGGFYQGHGNPNVQIRNSIFWGNTAQNAGAKEVYRNVNKPSAGLLAIDNTLVEGLNSGLAALGTGNIGGDPSFISADGGNLRLKNTSVAIDLANNLVDVDPYTLGAQPLPAFDLAGKARIAVGIPGNEPVVDMGAYEYQGG